MCGRFCFVPEPEKYHEQTGFDLPDLFEPVYNAAPGQMLAVAGMTSPARLQRMRWGLAAPWQKDPTGLINARGETLRTKPTFARLLAGGRCAVAATGFFEWSGQSKPKQPLLFQLRSQEPFFMAGLCDRADAGEHGRQPSFCIITTAANELMAPIHQRMPAMLTPDETRLWLSDGVMPLELLRPMRQDLMECFAVSLLVNAVANNHPGVLEPLRV